MRQSTPTKWIFLGMVVFLIGVLFLQSQYFASTGLFQFKPVERSTDFDPARIVSAGPGKDGIPSIDRPDFENVASANAYLDDNLSGIVIEQEGLSRFYPFQILVWHEVVNDEFRGKPLLISYSPLSYTAEVYERMVGQDVLDFGVTGEVYENNTLLYDRASNTRWSQARGVALDGQRQGSVLTSFPSYVLSWGGYKDRYPNGLVLSRETGFERDYTHDPHDAYTTNNALLFPLFVKDDRFHPKDLVYGFVSGDHSMAFFEETLIKQTVVNQQVGDQSIVIVRDPFYGSVRGYDRVVDEQTLTFEAGNKQMIDKETSSRWNFDGEAVSGQLQGQRLEPVQLHMSYWFSWFAWHPTTLISS